MNPEAQKALLFEIADALLRSWWTLVGGVCFGMVGAILVLTQIPKQYEATAKILVTPQSIPKEFVRTTVTHDMTQRLVVLEEAVLSERYMSKLIDRTYGSPATEVGVQSLIRSMRSRITVKPTAVSDATLLAFELTYRDTNKQMTALVVNTLAELYIEQNTEFRSSQAQETTHTMEERAESAKLEYEDAEKRLTDFKARHRFETEGYLEANLRRLELGKRDLENNIETQASVPARIRVLESQLSDLKSKASIDARIVQLETELEELLVRYSDVHPEVVKKRRQILELRESDKVTEQLVPDPSAVEADNPQYAAMDAEIQGLRRELSDLKSEEKTLRAQIAEYERWIQAVPEVQPQLMALETERENLYQRFQDLEDKLERARDSQYIEESTRGQRFELAERARVPNRAVLPKRIPAYALGLVGGCLLFVGPLLIRRFLNPLVSSESGLRALTDVPVLVSIPRVLTPSNKGLSTQRFVKNLGLSVVCMVSLFIVLFVTR